MDGDFAPQGGKKRRLEETPSSESKTSSKWKAQLQREKDGEDVNDKESSVSSPYGTPTRDNNRLIALASMYPQTINPSTSELIDVDEAGPAKKQCIATDPDKRLGSPSVHVVSGARWGGG